MQSEGLEVAPPVDTPFAGLVAERLAKHLEPMEHRPEVGVLVGRLLDGLLRFYTQSQYPVRRQRWVVGVFYQVVGSDAPLQTWQGSGQGDRVGLHEVNRKSCCGG